MASGWDSDGAPQGQYMRSWQRLPDRQLHNMSETGQPHSVTMSQWHIGSQVKGQLFCWVQILTSPRLLLLPCSRHQQSPYGKLIHIPSYRGRDGWFSAAVTLLYVILSIGIFLSLCQDFLWGDTAFSLVLVCALGSFCFYITFLFLFLFLFLFFSFLRQVSVLALLELAVHMGWGREFPAPVTAGRETNCEDGRMKTQVQPDIAGLDQTHLPNAAIPNPVTQLCRLQPQAIFVATS